MAHKIRLTQRDVQNAVRIDGKDTEYEIIGKKHMKIRVLKKVTSLVAYVTYRGKRYAKTLGHYPDMNLKVFERLADEYRSRVVQGQEGGLSNLTFDRFFEEYYLPLAKRTKKTWRGDQGKYERYLKSTIGAYRLQDVKTYTIQQLLNSLPDHLSDAYHNRIRALVHRVFNIAVKCELINRNPCSAVPTRRENNVVERIPTVEERRAFIIACLDDSLNPASLALLLALLTGARIGNIISITRSMLAADLSSIEFERTKNGKRQTVPLSKEARQVVEQALALSNSQYLFSSDRSDSGHIAYPIATFKRVCAQAGIAAAGGAHPITPGFPTTPITIHCLRKAFSSAVLEQTNDIHCCSTLLGHSDVKVTSQRYAFYQTSRLSLAVQDAADLMMDGIPSFQMRQGR